MKFPTILDMPINFAKSTVSFAKDTMYSVADHAKVTKSKITSVAYNIRSSIDSTICGVKSKVKGEVTKVVDGAKASKDAVKNRMSTIFDIIPKDLSKIKGGLHNVKSKFKKL